MGVFRAFIPIDLPPEIIKGLEGVTARLQGVLEGVPVRWVPSENIHLTLKFLGDVSDSNLEILTEMLVTEASAHRPFDISVGGLGAYPNMRRPRVIWVGVEAPHDMENLQRGIEAQTSRLGYAADRRSFSPHLTLGRVSRNATPRDIRSISQVLDRSQVGFIGVANVDAVHLYRSELKPGGAVYTRMYSAPLGRVGRG